MRKELLVQFQFHKTLELNPVQNNGWSAAQWAILSPLHSTSSSTAYYKTVARNNNNNNNNRRISSNRNSESAPKKTQINNKTNKIRTSRAHVVQKFWLLQSWITLGLGMDTKLWVLMGVGRWVLVTHSGGLWRDGRHRLLT
jgi:hypothetical protein